MLSDFHVISWEGLSSLLSSKNNNFPSVNHTTGFPHYREKIAAKLPRLVDFFPQIHQGLPPPRQKQEENLNQT